MVIGAWRRGEAGRSKVRVTDAQVHIWLPSSRERPWPSGGSQYAHGPELRAERLLTMMDEAGVDRAVLVPPSFEGDYNDYCLSAARRNPERLAVMGRLRLNEAQTVAELQRWRKECHVLGVRLTFNRGEMVNWLYDGTADWFWPAAQEAEIPVYIYAPGQTEALARIGAEHSALKVVIDHLNIPVGLVDEEIDAAIDSVMGLAPLENIAVKASALPCYVSDGYPFQSLHARIQRVVDAFGAERVFWGSDVSRLPCPYGQAVRLFVEELSFLNEEEIMLIMGKAVSRWLGWPESA